MALRNLSDGFGSTVGMMHDMHFRLIPQFYDLAFDLRCTRGCDSDLGVASGEDVS
jgi:hypothetical protein